MSKFVELEIQNLLRDSTPVEQVAERLITNLESSAAYMSAENISATARFLFQAGLYLSLIEFVLRHLDDEKFFIPWPYFLEALEKGSKSLSDQAVEALLEGIKETDGIADATRATGFIKSAPELQGELSARASKIQETYRANKRSLMDQLLILRTQQLIEEEKDLLNQLQALYPGDTEIQNEISAHRQRYAMEILTRRSPKNRSNSLDFLTTKNSVEDAEVEKSLVILQDVLLETAEQEPTLIKDLAVAAYVLEAYDTALEIMNLVPTEDASFAWLRLEILLAGRRFVELLGELTEVELALAHDPETFFATSYLRAQAYWGLGQKHTALEVIEGLLTARPHYRSASTLQSLWSSQ